MPFLDYNEAFYKDFSGNILYFAEMGLAFDTYLECYKAGKVNILRFG